MGGNVEVSAAELAGARWRKSRSSGKFGNCVEVAALDGGDVAIRHSKAPSGTALVYSRAELAAFLQGAKDGEFDDLVD